MIMNGNRPTLISGVPKRTPSLATIRSQASARPSAPARTCPLAAQIEGLPSSPISRVVHKGMAKQGWHRFASARELGDTLSKALRNEPIEFFRSEERRVGEEGR